MTVANFLGFAGVDETILGVGLDGFEEPEPGGFSFVGAHDEGFGLERFDVSGRCASVESGDGGHGVEVEPVDEHAEGTEDVLIVGVEEVIGPVEVCFEGALSASSASAGEELEAVVESGEKLVGVHDGYAGGGEFDGEGHAVESGADGADGRGVRVGEYEFGVDGGGAVDEETYGG